MSELEIVGPFRRVVERHGEHQQQEGREGEKGGSSPGFTHTGADSDGNGGRSSTSQKRDRITSAEAETAGGERWDSGSWEGDDGESRATVVFHGTDDDLADEVFDEGLKRGIEWAGKNPSVYFTTTQSVAELYGSRQSRFSDTTRYAIIELTIPKDAGSEVIKDGIPESWRMEQDVPPEWISAIHIMDESSGEVELIETITRSKHEDEDESSDEVPESGFAVVVLDPEGDTSQEGDTSENGEVSEEDVDSPESDTSGESTESEEGPSSQESDIDSDGEDAESSEDESSPNEEGSQEGEPEGEMETSESSQQDIEYWGFKIGDFKLLDKQDFDSGEEARQKEAAKGEKISGDLPRPPEKESALERAVTVLTNAVSALVQRQETPEAVVIPAPKVEITLNPEIKMDFPEHEQTMVVERDEDRFITKIIKRFTRGSTPKEEPEGSTISEAVRPGLGLEPKEEDDG